MLDLKHLHYAVTLAKYRNYARAAEALDISQPALSRSIAGLEAELGVQLFNRSSRGVEPTPFGERLLTRGSALLMDAAELERELTLMQGGEIGVLRVGAGPYAADLCVGLAIGRLSLRHPRVRVELNTGDWRGIIDGILTAATDIAVVELSGAELNPDLRTEPLPKHSGAFYCRFDHPLMREKPQSLERMFTFPFVCGRLPARAGQMFYQMAKTGSIDPETGDYVPPIKVDTIALAKSIVLSSDAVALAPIALIANEIQARQIATLPFREPWLHTGYGFVYLKDRMLSPAAHAFINEAKAVEAELVETERRVAALAA